MLSQIQSSSYPMRELSRAYPFEAAPSIAPSDTSSAAGFIPHRNGAVSNYYYQHRQQHAPSMGGLMRSNAFDRQESINSSRYADYNGWDSLSDVDYYRQYGNGSASESVATSSNFSQDSAATTASYRPKSSAATATAPPPTGLSAPPILKNGSTLPRSRTAIPYDSDRVASTTIDSSPRRNRMVRPQSIRNNYSGSYTRLNSLDNPGSPYQHRRSNSVLGYGDQNYFYNNFNRVNKKYSGGSVDRRQLERSTSNASSNINTLSNGNTVIRKTTNGSIVSTSNNHHNYRNSRSFSRSKDSEDTEEKDYPVILPKPSNSVQIIATPHRPGCCSRDGCLGQLCSLYLCCRRNSRHHAGRDGQTAPQPQPHQRQPVSICMLFTIFLVCSISIAVGVMVFTRGGQMSRLLSLDEDNSSSSTSSSSSSKQHTALSTTRRCENGLCAFGGVCIETADGGSRCLCDDICPFEFSPICGSDGVTYENECRMRLASCQRKEHIQKMHSGQCGKPNNPCLHLTCPKFSTCVPSVDGSTASCHCPKSCDLNMTGNGLTVCGSNGVEYESECHLEKDACEKRQLNLVVRYRGRCDPCRHVECPEGTECHLLGDGTEEDPRREPRCLCRTDCNPEDFSPVCASNGKTYRNDCFMKLDSCRRRMDLHTIHTGNCSEGLNPCGLLACQFGQECSTTKQGISECTCPSSCEPVVRPVCASDGHTYDNLCQMTRNACQRSVNISAKYYGICNTNGPCSNRECNHGSLCVESGDLAFCECQNCPSHFDPVCGSDGRTYENECQLRREACSKEMDIKIVEDRACSGCVNVTCDHYGVCVPGGRCECPSRCDQLSPDDLHQGPVCGSDGHTYQNECHLRMEACRKGQFIMVANLGECDLCRGVTCHHGAKCEGGACVCPVHCVGQPYRPLCAADLNTYDNECELERKSCHLGMDLKVLHEGTCQSPGHPNSIDQDSPHFDSSNQTPSVSGFPCYCNYLGTVQGQASACDPITGQCRCLSGVTGRACDRCDTQYWGFKLIARGRIGCTPCHCSPYGSVRPDCEQTGGKCVCKPGIHGSKCDTCPDGTKVSAIGCDSLYFPVGSMPVACGSTTCFYGAKCMSGSTCSCDFNCPAEDSAATLQVCGTDGHTYPNECQLLKYTCSHNTHVLITNYGPCKVGMTALVTPSYFTQVPEQDPTDLWPKTTRETGFAYEPRPYSRPFDVIAEVSPPTVTSSSYLGGFCSKDEDCKVSNSVCESDGRCSCRMGFREHDKGRKCIYASPPPKKSSPCSPNPCQGGGTCEEHDGTFTCFCPSDRTGATCQTAIKAVAVVPEFDGMHSFVELKTLENAEHRLSIEIEFKAYSDTGVILYADGSHGDLIAVLLSDGFVEFRYDLGTGMAVIRSFHQITLGSWHRIQVQRWHKDGSLKIDDHDRSIGQSDGSERQLDLDSPTFIGSAKYIGKLSRIDMKDPIGFHGCIRSFKLGYREVKIQALSEPQVVRRYALTECGSSGCSGMPCQNGATCTSSQSASFTCLCKPGFYGHDCSLPYPYATLDAEAAAVVPMQSRLDPCASSPCLNGGTCSTSTQIAHFVCQCPQGTSGLLCQHQDNQIESMVDHDKSAVFVAAFSGSSFLELPTLQHVSKAFQLELWFLTYESQGALLYNGRKANGDGDFVSIALVQGFVQFTFDLGSGPVSLTSNTKVTLDNWHRVKVARYGRKASLTLDEGPSITGMSKGPHTELNLEQPLYVGGFRYGYSINPNSGITKGLNGAIQALIVNGNPVESLIDVAKESHNVARFLGPPCDQNNCLNGGTCQPMLNSYVCKCSSGFVGQFCENKLDVSDKEASVAFDGETFLSFLNRKTRSLSNQLIETENYDEAFDALDESFFGSHSGDGKDYEVDDESRKGERHNKITFIFRTTSEDGLLFWTSLGPSLKRDFMAVAMVKGVPEISYNLGKESKKLLRISSEVKVNDGSWHKLKVMRKRRIGIIQVDKEEPRRGRSSPGATVLNTDGKIWIGGKQSLPPGLPDAYYKGFQGCLKTVKLFRRHLNLLRDSLGHHAPPKLCPVSDDTPEL